MLTSLVGLALAVTSSFVMAEGSRQLYPSTYPGTGARANLDLQDNGRYMDRVNRLGFIYVYAQQDEYITLGSSNIGSGGDVNIYLPQDFGIPGDETVPASADFNCADSTPSIPGTHFSGSNFGRILSRSEELAGPNSPDNTVTVSNGYQPCAFQAPETGIYGILFTTGSGGGPNGNIGSVASSSRTVAAWDVSIRAARDSINDLDGRTFTYAFIGFTGSNNRPVYSTLYYVTEDGYRYQQDLRGLDPNGYALYANTFGFLDDNEPLYKTLRSDNWPVDNLPLGVSAQAAEYPIFFSDISPGSVAEPGMTLVLNALGIPLEPPSPQISNVTFDGSLGGSVTATGSGGVFSFDTTDTVSYQIIISRDGSDFDPATPANRVLTGIAYSGVHQVTWDGLDNNNQPFPASATPYAYRASGRNGEVHFPIIDAENNGNPPSIQGGGPTITRLNGTDPNDRTVFFDDRGYLTRSGELIGNLNGTLCPGPSPAAADPAVSLTGVDSSTVYRQWEYGGNSNSDCNGSAGWGDAKGVNLWTYFLTPPENAALEIRDFPVDVATAISTVDTAEAGATVQGSFSFSNNGTDTANAVSYSMTMSTGLGSVTFGNLPPGASASYNNGSGVVTLANFPAALAGGEQWSNMTFSYTAPATGPVVVTTTIDTSDVDQVPANNTATASTAIGSVDVGTTITGVPSRADPGSTVSGSILFSNVGTDDAQGITYEASIGSPGNAPASVQFTSLPSGVSATYNSATGEVSFTGMPATLVEGAVLSVSFSYLAPGLDGGSIAVVSSIGTTSDDANPANNTASATTAIDFPTGAAIDIAAQSFCERNAPWVGYDVTPINFVPNTLATVEFLGSDDAVVATYTDQPLSNGRLLWPDAEVDGSGNGSVWPGWEQVEGEWQEAPSLVRPELRVRISVNPTSEVTITYPGVSPGCDPNPPGTSSPGAGVSPQAIPALPLPLLLLLSALLGASAARQLRRPNL